MLRILIADPHPVLRKGVRALIERHCGWEVCGEASDGAEAWGMAVRDPPDVAIVDTWLSGLDGVALTARLHTDCPRTRVLIFTIADDEGTVRRALAAGARGYILKRDGQHALEDAISVVGANRPSFSSIVSEMLLNEVTGAGPRERLRALTEREREVGQLIADGNSNRQIAGLFGISIKTVESHRTAAMRKVGVTNASQFVRFAIRNKLITA